MKIKELIPLLMKLNPEHEVILSSDCFGDSFSKLEKISKGYYEEDSPYYVEFSEINEQPPNSITLYPKD